MIETLVPGRQAVMSLMPSCRADKFDNICEELLEELLKERAAVLGRAGAAVEGALAELAAIDQQIGIRIERLNLLVKNQTPDNMDERLKLSEEINTVIHQFNTIREKAKLKYYYLIVTREALGLRRHGLIQEIYVIPAKKKKIQVF